MLPRPAQAPHPPLFLARSRAETLRTAADFGIGALVLGFAGVDEVICLIQMGTVPQAAAMETIRQWGTYVIPGFRGK